MIFNKLANNLGFNTNIIYLISHDDGNYTYPSEEEDLAKLCDIEVSVIKKFLKEAGKLRIICQLSKTDTIWIVNPLYVWNGDYTPYDLLNMFNRQDREPSIESRIKGE